MSLAVINGPGSQYITGVTPQISKGAGYAESTFFPERAERQSVKTFPQNDAQVGRKV
jgi:hypothetical protein